MPNIFTDKMIETLANLSIPSTQRMGQFEKYDGVQLMLSDLNALAEKDGCIAAAWALEVLELVSEKKE